MDAPVYNDLKDKVVLVTGASRGIGRAIALALAAQKAHVVFNCRTKIPANEEKLIQEIESRGGKATPLYFDVANYNEVQAAAKQLSDLGIVVNGLVNNAGVSKDQLALRLKEEDINYIIDTNLKSVINMMSLFSRYFLKAKDVSIVNISSVVGLMGNPSQLLYSASKAGILGATKSYAKEMASKSIRCNAVCPGFIETDMTHNLADKAKESYLEQIPLSRMGQADEVASLVLFLLSNVSSYITGEIIKIDGGLYI
jgi:3-oxoacyl-[acyl-carrier protein] reductase